MLMTDTKIQTEVHASIVSEYDHESHAPAMLPKNTNIINFMEQGQQMDFNKKQSVSDLNKTGSALMEINSLQST